MASPRLPAEGLDPVLSPGARVLQAFGFFGGFTMFDTGMSLFRAPPLPLH